MIYYGFDVEGSKFSMDYVKQKFECLHKKVNLLEIPVYVFIKNFKIDKELLKEFLDFSQSFDFKFTAHAEDSLEFFVSDPKSKYEVKKMNLNLKVAESIEAIKLVVHQKFLGGKPIIEKKRRQGPEIVVENTPSLNPVHLYQYCQYYNVGFTLDVPHAFLYYAEKNEFALPYEELPNIKADHLHLSNTYFKTPSMLEYARCILKGDFRSAFVKLRGDFHLPLPYGHIDYKKLFPKLKIPDTIIMEISTSNYLLMMRGKNPEAKITKGYSEDIKYLKKLLKGKL